MSKLHSDRLLIFPVIVLLFGLLFGSMSTAPAGAVAAEGEYNVQITAPQTVPHGRGFTYTVTMEAGVTEDKPITGVVLTTKLAEGLTLDSVATAGESPVESYDYDEATRTVTLTLKPLVKQLSTFLFSVRNVNDDIKAQGFTYETTVTGSPTASGQPPTSSATTEVIGTNNYPATKRADVVPGSGNRVITYRFNAYPQSDGTSDNFTSVAQRFTDVLPAGVQITGSSPGWTITKNDDGTTTAVLELDRTFRHASSRLDSTENAFWITVRYPVETFPTGTTPPPNTVKFETKDAAGTWYEQRAATATGPALTEGAPGSISMVKGTASGNDTAVWQSGRWASSYNVDASFFHQPEDATDLDSLTLEDSALQSEENKQFFNHFSVQGITFNFGGSLSRTPVPFTFEYLTNDSPTTWKTLSQATALRTSGRVAFSTQVAGSVDFPGINVGLQPGQRIVGWRIVVSPDKATTITDGAVIQTVVSGVPSATSLEDSSINVKSIHNTAEAVGYFPNEREVKFSDDMTRTLADRINIVTWVDAPATIEVGKSANYTASIANFDPAGRSYKDSTLRVVLPVGVTYDERAGITPVAQQTAVGLPYPQQGTDYTVSTETVTDAAGEHEVVVLRFKDLPSAHTAGQPMSRALRPDAFTFNVPTVVQPAAYVPGTASVPVTSWATTDDARYTDLPIAFYPSFHAADAYNFDAHRDVISRRAASSIINVSGGLLMGKMVRAEGATRWSGYSTIPSPGTAEWVVYIRNVLPKAVSDVVVFDRLPFAQDSMDSEFASTLAGPVTKLPEGAVAEYSTDATAADNGTWTTDPTGATAIRVKLGTIASGATASFIFPTTVPADLMADDYAGNIATATGQYEGALRNFTSTKASIQVAAAPAFTVEKKTNGKVYTEAPGAQVATGSNVEWTYVVTNTGNAILDDITLADAYTAGDGSEGTLTPTSSEEGPLQPGQSREYKADAKAIWGQYENTVTAKATAVAEDGEPFKTQPEPAKASSWYYARTASISLAKTVSASSDGAFAEQAEIVKGQTAYWQLVVTNTGEADLADVVIKDPALGEPITVGDLAAGATFTKVVEQRDVTEGYRNTATATGNGPSGEVSAEDGAEITVIDPPTTVPTKPGTHSKLPKTGVTIATTSLVALFALVAGAGLVLVSRRRS